MASISSHLSTYLDTMYAGRLLAGVAIGVAASALTGLTRTGVVPNAGPCSADVAEESA